VNDLQDKQLHLASWSFQDIVGQQLEWTPRRQPRTVTASGNVNPLDDLILVDCTAGAVTMTLETCVGCDGRQHMFKKIDSSSNAMTIDGAGAELIDTAANVSTTVQGITFWLKSRGVTGWASVILLPGTAPAAGTVTSVGFTDTNDDTQTASGGPITTSGTLDIAAVDAGSDKIVFWDDSAGKKDYLTPGTGLSISGTTMTVVITDTNDDTQTASGNDIAAADAGSDKGVFWDDSAGKKDYFTLAGSLGFSGTVLQDYQWLQFAITDQTTVITTGTAKFTTRFPACTVLAVRASLKTASSSGTPTVDINESGTTILSTKLTIDANELTSTTAASAAVISDATIADDAEITFDIDTAGTGAVGLIVTMQVRWT